MSKNHHSTRIKTYHLSNPLKLIFGTPLTREALFSLRGMEEKEFK
jgi:hypothetical protein